MDKLTIINRALARCGTEPIATLADTSKRALLAVDQYEATLREILNDSPWNFATDRVRLDKSVAPVYGFSWTYTIPSTVIRILEVNQQDAYRVESGKLLTNYNDGAASVAITRVSTTATAVAAHTFITGDLVYISGCTQTAYNGVFTVTVIDSNTFTFTVSGSPATPATGTPVFVRDTSVLKARAIVYNSAESTWTPSFIKAFYLKLAEDMAYSLVQSATLQNGIIQEAERYLRRARSYNSQEGTPESRYPEDATTSLRL